MVIPQPKGWANSLLHLCMRSIKSQNYLCSSIQIKLSPIMTCVALGNKIFFTVEDLVGADSR